MTPVRWTGYAPVVLLLLAGPLRGQEAADVYARYASEVVKVEVLETAAQAPSSVGTAFFAAESTLLTNYHVIRQLLFEPQTYSLRLVGSDGADAGSATIVAVDPAHDLAVLRVAYPHTPSLTLTEDPIPMGVTLYSMGHPADLRTSVVEGVFNGFVEYAFAPMMHFSGAINPGMSGGPTVRADGAVVGINVASGGNQLGFLVPATLGRALLEEAALAGAPTVADLQARASDKLHAFQDGVYAPLLEAGLPTTTIRRATVPTGPDDRFDCAADAHEIEGDQYEVIEYRCDTADDMLIGPRRVDDLVYVEHVFLGAGELPVRAFYTLFTEWYSTVLEWEVSENRDATDYRCERDRVETGAGETLMVAFCVRRHLPHDGLFELFLRTALLGGDREGVVSTLRASPLSFDHAVSLTAQWLERFSWSR